MSALEALKLIAPTVHLSAEQGTVSAEQGSVARGPRLTTAYQLSARCVRVFLPRGKPGRRHGHPGTFRWRQMNL